ncbi:penicillin-binding protein activator LpoB [Leptospira sp. GIMC2001]|uniref:penicillin-binding protein activator LpoB n=1 Tax=Leptospira sp. GIMC2001 TaxID=1513297 RepID=UPI00234A05F3|nr:penicillin-binding protein activator LpoB [Leptospira sp. GIMC2001]WCL48555.1 penicillin-binding protein activator LpoB [Leptospira sp. GIMC2001]
MFRFTVLILLALLLTTSCSSGAKRLDLETDLVSDSGGLTRQELEKAAARFGKEIGAYFKENPRDEGIFVAHFPTRNNTTEMIPTEFFDNSFVSQLIRNKIFTVRTDTREKSINEMTFSLSGMTGNRLSLGKMKSPNFFVRCDIDENIFTVKGDRIVEQTVNIELVEVETNIAVWNERVAYRKQAVVGNRGVGW